jgi:uncharacterized membrane protein YkvA (DUF1232 family)
MNKPTSSSDLQEDAGFLGGLIKQARLSWRLFKDGRVPGWAKLIPVAALLYFLSPIDFVPDWALPGIGEVDDIVVFLLALKMFVDLSPPGIVREHLEDLLGARTGTRPAGNGPADPYIDAPYEVLDQNKE